MTNSALIAASALALSPLIAAAGGESMTAASMDEAVAFLSAAPNRFRVIFVWPGYGSHPAAREGMANHRLTAVVQAPRGLGPDRPGSGASFDALVETVSAMVRALRFPDGWEVDNAGWALESSGWIEAPKTTRAHALTFEMAGALPSRSALIPVPLPT